MQIYAIKPHHQTFKQLFLKKDFCLKIRNSKNKLYICIMITTTTRPLYEIAKEIKTDWTKVNYGAAPYLQAMASLNSINDNYYEDSAKSVVAYFLSNATTWRGETAKRVKLELNKLIK